MVGRKRHASGFTLVELLIVLVLLSLIMLALVSALHTTSQTEERVDARLQRVDDLRIVNDFLRSVLGRISAQKSAMPIAAGGGEFFFTGDAEALVWVGVMPARYGAGGRCHFRLMLEAGELILLYVPWVDASSQPVWSSAQRVRLLSGVKGLSMRYEDAVGEPPVWVARWVIADRLPQRVFIGVQTQNGSWPDLIIPLRVLPSSDSRSGGPSFGGGA